MLININPTLLKIFHKELSKPIYIIFKKSLQERKVPQDWKMTNISPIYKKRNSKEVSNSRPVSMTSVISKILERNITRELWPILPIINFSTTLNMDF